MEKTSVFFIYEKKCTRIFLFTISRTSTASPSGKSFPVQAVVIRQSSTSPHTTSPPHISTKDSFNIFTLGEVILRKVAGVKGRGGEGGGGGGRRYACVSRDVGYSLISQPKELDDRKKGMNMNIR